METGAIVGVVGECGYLTSRSVVGLSPTVRVLGIGGNVLGD